MLPIVGPWMRLFAMIHGAQNTTRKWRTNWYMATIYPKIATSNRPTLYERLGGVYSIATVVDDPRLNANPRVDEAYHRVSAGDEEAMRSFPAR